MDPVRHASSADGTRVGFRASGTDEPIVFVHGAATSSLDWILVARLLRERFTVVTMDRRGRGESADGPEYSMEREAEDIVAVLDAVGGELLVGHSFGALCSILVPERTDRLRRLVLYEPPIAVDPGRLDALDSLVAEGQLEAALEGFLGSAGTPADQLDAIRSSPAWPVLLNAVPVLPRELRAAVRWPRPEAPIAVPTLYLVGGETKARAYLDGLDDILALFTDVRRATIPGQQHVGHVFAAREFADLVAEFCGDAQT